MNNFYEDAELVAMRTQSTGEAAEERGSSTEQHLVKVEELFSIRRPDMLRYLARMGGNVVEAEEIVQDVFVRIVADAAHKRPDNLFSWLLTCA